MLPNKQDKIAKLALNSRTEKTTAKWKEIARWNRANADSLENYAIIATKILQSLKTKGMHQNQLAKELGLKTEALTNMLRGRQNLRLQTIRKIEKVLAIQLIEHTV